MVSRITGTITLLALTVLVALRPLIAETYDSAQSSIDRALDTLADPTPLRTLLFDSLILVSALVTAVIHLRGRIAWTRPPVWVLGLMLLVIAGGASCFFAGNQRLAINATIDWLCLPILTLTLVPLLRESWQRRLLLAAIVGSASIQTFECYEQYTYGFSETIEHYEAHKDEFWQSQGVEPDAPQVELFESRMNAREVSGFMPHSNVAGSYFVLILFCGLGLSFARIRRWRAMGDPLQQIFAIAVVVVTLAVVIITPLTGSRGAMLAGAGSLALWGVCRAFGGPIRRNRRAVFGAGWIAFGLIVAATIGHGLYHKSLPGVSLTFRWQYWTASAEMVADHPWTGVGRENFGRHYLQYKSIESPEEVSNPHNLFVQAAADWGVPGLLGMILLLIGGSRAVVLGRRNGAHDSDDRPALTDSPVPSSFSSRTTLPLSREGLLSNGARVGLFAGLTLVTLGARVPLFGTADPDFVYYKTVTGALAWLVGAGAVWFWSEHKRNADDHESEASIATCVAWGLLAFLVHDLVNFALFIPATATTFCALTAYVLSVRIAHGKPNEARPSIVSKKICIIASPLTKGGLRGVVRSTKNLPQPLLVKEGGKKSNDLARTDTSQQTVKLSARSNWSRWISPVFLGTLIAVVIFLGLVPVARSGARLAQARVLTAVLPVGDAVKNHPAHIAFEQAASADPLDPTPLDEQGRWLAAVAKAYPENAISTLDLASDSIQRAIARDPFRVGLFRILRRILLSRASASGLRADYEKAIDAAREALTLYPDDPSGLVLLADTLAETGDALEDPLFSREAIDTYKAALALDDQRIEWETLRRFRPKKRVEIQERIERISAAMGER